MDIIKAFKLNDSEHEINIKGDNKNPLFQANQIGEILEIKNIRMTLKDFPSNMKIILKTKTKTGDKNTTFLTFDGLKNLIMISKKPIALTFKKWIMNVIDEIRDTGNYKEKEDNQVDIEFRKGREQNNPELLIVRNNTLIETMKKKKVVYLTQIRNYNEEGKRIIKIGSSEDISNRNPQLKQSFGESILLNVFEVNRHSDFEKYLQKHNEISIHQYTMPINGLNSREMFLLDDKMFERLIFIIHHEIKKFHNLNHEQLIELKNIELEEQKIELEKQRFELENKRIELENKKIELENKRIQLEFEKTKTKNSIIDKLDNNDLKEYLPQLQIENNIIKDFEFDENEYINNNLNNSENNSLSDDETDNDSDNDSDKEKNNNNDNTNIYKGEINENKPKRTNGGIIQQYDPNTFKLIKSYNTLKDITKDELFKELPVSSFKRATQINNVYAGYRWYEIQRNQEIKEYQIPQTVNIKQSKRAYIAQIDLYKTKILEVYSSQKTAAKKLGGNLGSICRAVNDPDFKHQASSSYWRFFDDCTTNLKTEFLKNNKLPSKEKIKNGQKRVQKINPVTREIEYTYDSITTVEKLLNTARRTIQNSSKNNTIFKNYIWKIID